MATKREDYGSCIDEKNVLEIYAFKTNDEEDMGRVVLKLPHESTMDVRRAKTKMFDTETEMIEFINSEHVRSKQSYNYHFSPMAYDIINEHYIKLYYQGDYSNA